MNVGIALDAVSMLKEVILVMGVSGVFPSCIWFNISLICVNSLANCVVSFERSLPWFFCINRLNLSFRNSMSSNFDKMVSFL